MNTVNTINTRRTRAPAKNLLDLIPKDPVARAAFVKKFEAKFTRGDKDECWEWQANKIYEGYGLMMLPRDENGKATATTAHRLAYVLRCGIDISKTCITHKCDNRACVNPNHLVPGDQKYNMLDMFEKGRNGDTRHKLNQQQIDELRSKYASGGYTQRALAAEYDCSIPNISKHVRAIY